MYLYVYTNSFLIFFSDKGYRRSIRRKINTGGSFINIKTRVSNPLPLLMVIYMYRHFVPTSYIIPRIDFTGITIYYLYLSDTASASCHHIFLLLNIYLLS